MRAFFEAEAPRLARASQEVAERFARGGRLYAFGNGPYATDAAHVSVEFIHPVIVGKRALPAMDASAAPEAFVEALVGPDDMAIAFGPPEGDLRTIAALRHARRRGAYTLAWPGIEADYSVDVADRRRARAPGSCSRCSATRCTRACTCSWSTGASWATTSARRRSCIRISAPRSPTAARSSTASRRRSSRRRATASGCASRSPPSSRTRSRRRSSRCGERIARGGRLLIFGNGGSATDATDFALDCVLDAPGMRAVPAISLAAEPAVLSAIANDVGAELTFLRQLIAQSRPDDVAFAMSTSGGSKNVVAALEEARKRGLLTVALLGYDGGEIVRRGLADHAIVVRCDYIPRIQEAQAAIYHVMRRALAELGSDAG